MASVEATECISDHQSEENECPTQPKVLKHCTKFTFGRRKHGSKSAQLQAARERRESGPEPETVASPVLLSANPSTVRRTVPVVAMHSASASSSKLALLKAANEQANPMPSVDGNGK